MGNSFGFLRTEGGFQFTVLDACEAEGIDLNKTCSLVFDSNGGLLSIGNVTKGTMKPEPGVAGIGVSRKSNSKFLTNFGQMWLAFIAFFVVILSALIFIIIEFVTRAPNLYAILEHIHRCMLISGIQSSRLLCCFQGLED